MNACEIDVADADAMEALGAAMARQIATGLVIYLVGDLGAGKTTLVRGFLRGCGYSGRVRSPTYTLIEPYDIALDAPVQTLYHLDLYRLGDPEELEWIGIRDLMTGTELLLVEWPEQGQGALPPADLVIAIDYRDTGRQLDLRATSERGRRWLAAMPDRRRSGVG